MSTLYPIFVGILIICSTYHHAAASTKTIFELCLKNQFQCPLEDKCIPIHRRCDADFDNSSGCSDGSHNAGCDKRQCSEGEHRCGNGYCIPPSSVCDGRIDCFDRSDEKDCAPFTDPICLRNQFRCSNGKCISILQRCDGACSDGSDESSWCHEFCPEGYVPCNNTLKSGTRKCIPKSHICNGETDCPDKSDEEDCDKCKNWGCSYDCVDVPERGPSCVCERGYDASFHERRTCRKIIKKIGDSLHCLRNEFACKDGKKCIPVHRRCDLNVNLTLGCSDRSHLADCDLEAIGRHRCLDGEHQCGSGKCIPDAWVCDGLANCKDESDEPKDCPHITDPVCLRNQFRCHTSYLLLCIRIYMRCDGVFSAVLSCPDYSDEFECPENWCPEGYLRCDKKMDDGTKNCIPKSRFCDGEPDCKDGWDEKDCDKCENWGCSEFCKETSPWPECFCKEGFELDKKDKRTCKKKENLNGK